MTRRDEARRDPGSPPVASSNDMDDAGGAATREASRQLAPDRRRSAWIVLAWLIVTGLLIGAVHRQGTPWRTDEVDALVPAEHRSPRGEPLVLLRIDPARAREQVDELGEVDASSHLHTAARRIDEALEQRVPLVVPPGDSDAWLDTHALYLLPPEEHAHLAERLSRESITAAIQGLRARLSSPLFGVSGEEARRDPLALRELMHRAPGQLGPTGVEGASAIGPRATPSGDMISSDGASILIQLRDARAPTLILAEVSDAVGDEPVIIDLLGPEARAESVASVLRDDGPQLTLATMAALALVLALGLRRVRPVLAILGCLVTGAVALVRVSGGLDPLALSLTVLLCAFACDAALRLPRISTGGWASTLVFAGALAPLLLGPYPLWRTWAWQWGVGYLAVAVLIRLAMPAMLRLLGDAGPWRRPDFVLRPMPGLALAVCVGFGAGGAWAAQRLRVVGPSHASFIGERLAAAEASLRAQLVDPQLVVELDSRGSSGVEALEAAASDVERLGEWLPAHATYVDSPAAMILGGDELERRRASLSRLGMRRRAQDLHDALDAGGFRADAFSEFLSGSADIERQPSAQAALDGPLAPWIARYLVEPGDRPNRAGPDTWSLRSRVQLRPAAPNTALPPLHDDDGRTLALHGPAIADRDDTATFVDRLGLYLVCGLWFGALLVWLGTRRLSSAIASAMVSLSAVCGVLIAMVPLHLELGPHLLPPLLLVGAAAMVAAGRSCRAAALGQRIVASGILLAGICQAVAGLCLSTTSQPLWRDTGLVIALGCALACGLGLFVAPAMDLLLRRATGADRRDSPSVASPTPDERDAP